MNARSGMSTISSLMFQSHSIPIKLRGYIIIKLLILYKLPDAAELLVP